MYYFTWQIRYVLRSSIPYSGDCIVANYYRCDVSSVIKIGNYVNET